MQIPTQKKMKKEICSHTQSYTPALIKNLEVFFKKRAYLLTIFWTLDTFMCNLNVHHQKKTKLKAAFLN